MTLKREDVVTRGEKGRLFYTHNGETMDKFGWAERLGISAIQFAKRTQSHPIERWFEPSARNEKKYITFNGETKTVEEWSDETGVPRATIFQRLSKGMPIESVLSLEGCSDEVKRRFASRDVSDDVAEERVKLTPEELHLHNRITSLKAQGFSDEEIYEQLSKRAA